MNGDALIKKTTKIMFGDAGISGTAQYMSQLVWVLFLKVFDYKEEEWELEGDYSPVIPEPFRFRDWADPRKENGVKDYSNRLTGDKLINFVNNTLFPFLRGVEVEYKGEKLLFASNDSKATIIRSFMAESQNYMKDGVRLRQLINEIGDVDFDIASEKHDFNDFYERLLKELQNGGTATGEFYTPRAITSFIVDHVNPRIGENVADFACGTGGFLAESITHLQKQARSIEDLQKIQDSVYGIEWKQLPYMLCVTNMYLHNIDNPQIVHGDGLAKDVLDLSEKDLFSCIVMNPPFGGEFNKADLKNFPNSISSSESADLFVARIIYCLKKNGRCGLVLPDGLLFNGDQSKVNLKQLLLKECNLHTVIRLPGSVFAPYTDISTNLLFFDKTGKTKEVWFYRMDMPEGRKHFNKTHPITRDDMRVIDEWWNNRREIKDEKDDPSMKETWKSKKYSFDDIESDGFNLDLCGFPDEEEIILSPKEVIDSFKTRRENLEALLDSKMTGLTHALVNKNDSEFMISGLSAIEKQLVDMHKTFSEELRKSILQYAMQGKLVEQRQEEGTSDDLLQRIQKDKNALIKAGKIKKEAPLPEITKKDTPFEIPKSWRWVHLNDIVAKNIRRGKSPTYTTKSSNVLVFAQKCNVKNGGIDLSLCQFLDESVLEKYPEEEYMLDNDIVINSTGTGTMGRVGIYSLSDNKYGKRLVPDSHVTIVRLVDKVYSPYIYYIICNYQRYLEGKGSGSTKQKELKPDIIKALLIPIPPFEEQRRIVAKLDQVLPQTGEIDDGVS